jgi:hypothetical protein
MKENNVQGKKKLEECKEQEQLEGKRKYNKKEANNAGKKQ